MGSGGPTDQFPVKKQCGMCTQPVGGKHSGTVVIVVFQQLQKPNHAVKTLFLDYRQCYLTAQMESQRV